MAIFNTVWSIDVGRSSLKAVKLRREKNNIEILEVDKVDYTVGADGVDFAQQSKEALSIFKSRNDVKEPVIVCHNGQGTLSKFIEIPAFDQKKIKEMVGYEAQQQIPFDLDEVIWDYHLIERDYMPGEEREVGLFAARKEMIEDYLVDFETEELNVEGVTIGYLGLLNFILYDIAPEEPTIFLDIGDSHTDLILVDGKRFWTRNLPHSGNEMTKAVQTRLKLNYSEAEKIKIHCAKNKAQAAKIFQAIIMPKLKELVNEIQRSIGYYRTQSGEVQFKQVYLLGNASKIVGGKKFLQEHLGLPVHTLQGISRLRINRDANLKLLQAHLPAFATAFGSALQGVGVGSCRVDLLPQEEKLQKELGRKKKHVLVALAIMYAVVLAGGFMVKGKVLTDQSSDVKSLTSYVSKVRKVQKAVDAIQEESIDSEAKLLVDVGRLRNMPQLAIQIVGDALKDVQQQPKQGKSLNVDRDIKIEEVRSQVQEMVNKGAWVPFIDIKKINWPENAAAAPRGDGGRGSRKRGATQKLTVPAYKVSLRVFVKEQADQEKSLKHLRSLVVNKIKRSLRKLQDDKIIKDPEVVDGIDARTESRIYYTDSNRAATTGGSRRRGDNQVVLVQEGGPFFSAGVTFILRAEDPPKPEAKAEGDEDENDGKKGRKPKKKTNKDD